MTLPLSLPHPLPPPLPLTLSLSLRHTHEPSQVYCAHSEHILIAHACHRAPTPVMSWAVCVGQYVSKYS